MDGSVVCWGENYCGECNVPEPNEDFILIAAGGANTYRYRAHSMGIKVDDTVICWGSNNWGQCDVPFPNEDFISVAAGGIHSVGLKSDGSIVCWGCNTLDQCDIPEPNEDFIAIAAGVGHSMGLKSDGSVICWGLNDCGQCDVPILNVKFVMIAAGGQPYYGGGDEVREDHFSMGLTSDGSVICWGNNSFGQCDVPESNTEFVAIAGGGRHALGLKEDGSIVCWGNNSFGQCDVPGLNAGFIEIAAGSFHSLGLKEDGSIVCWGANFTGQCDVPEPNQDFVGIAGGPGHSVGLRGIETGIEDDPIMISSLVLNSPAPNPFSNSASISFNLPTYSSVTLVVYDLSGRIVETLIDASLESGEHSVVFDGCGLSEGMYLIRLTTPTTTCTERCVLIR